MNKEWQREVSIPGAFRTGLGAYTANLVHWSSRRTLMLHTYSLSEKVVYRLRTYFNEVYFYFTGYDVMRRRPIVKILSSTWVYNLCCNRTGRRTIFAKLAPTTMENFCKLDSNYWKMERVFKPQSKCFTLNYRRDSRSLSERIHVSSRSWKAMLRRRCWSTDAAHV